MHITTPLLLDVHVVASSVQNPLMTSAPLELRQLTPASKSWTGVPPGPVLGPPVTHSGCLKPGAEIPTPVFHWPTALLEAGTMYLGTICFIGN